MLVDEVLKALSSEISQHEFDRFIKQIRYNEKASTEDRIVFTAPNELIAKYIKTCYAGKIAHLFEVRTSKKPEIEITTQKGAKAKKINITNTKTQSSLLNTAFTFDRFIVGESNQDVFAMAKAAAKYPGENFNPLFIHGPTGLGKTHLLQSVGNYCLDQGKIVICVDGEQFFNEFKYHLKMQSTDKFREKYRNCDVLLIDDVQFFGDKQSVQNEFYHTFNAIQSKKGQIVMISDKPPHTLKGFEERLISRFAGGLTGSINPPDLETKLLIIKKKCDFNEINLSKEIIEYIAVNMGDNIREIEGAITDLNFYKRMLQQNITLEIAKNIIKDRIKERLENVNLDDIISFVSKELNVKPSDMKSKSKVAKIVQARHIVIYLAKQLTTNSMPQIANYFGMKDHSAVSHNIRNINKKMEKDERLKLLIEEIQNKLVSKK